MHVKSFMSPVEKVAICRSDDSIRKALDLMVEKKIGAIVVQDDPTDLRPVGIITKTDMTEAYQKGLTLDDHVVNDILHSTELMTVEDGWSRDHAAKVMEKSGRHHAIVVNNGKFVGLVSAWDIASECAKDDRAWPWNRADDGKFHMPNEMALASSPKGPVCMQKAEESGGKRSSFMHYIDTLEFMDV